MFGTGLENLGKGTRVVAPHHHRGSIFPLNLICSSQSVCAWLFNSLLRLPFSAGFLKIPTFKSDIKPRLEIET